MGKTISIINQKGGVGKTTTALALIGGLQEQKYKVLAVDLDSQCNLTYTMGAEEAELTALEVIEGEDIEKCITETPNGYLLPASQELYGLLNAELTGNELKTALKKIKGKYDYIVIDTPPALSNITVNALLASDEIILTAQADMYSLKGLEAVADTMKQAKKYNRNLKTAGILLVRYNGRSIFTQQLAEIATATAETFGTKLFKATIREAIAIKEAQALKRSIYDYAPKAKVTADCRAFVTEYLENSK